MTQYGNKNNGRATDPMDLFSELFSKKLGEKSAPTSRERSIFNEFEQHLESFKDFTHDFIDEQMRGERAGSDNDVKDEASKETLTSAKDADDARRFARENEEKTDRLFSQFPAEDSDSLIEALDRHREAVAAGSEDLAEAINNLAEALRR